jgi:addiction module HigA family antidote
MRKTLPNIHPGEILNEEFMQPLEVTGYRLAKDTGLDPKRISDIIHKKRSISADTALRLSKFFGTTAQFWLNLQNSFDLEEKQKELGKVLAKIHRYSEEAVASVGR